MAKERKAYAPFSLTSEAGVAQTPVEGYIDVVQKIYPSVTTGTINENGKWTGVRASDSEFIAFTKAELVAQGGAALFPDSTEFPSLDMTGFKNIFLAIKPSLGGSVAMEAVMGPDTERFANLNPVNAGVSLRGNVDPRSAGIDALFSDGADNLTTGVWNIYYIGVDRLADQKNLQIKITNNTAGSSTFEVAFMRLV